MVALRHRRRPPIIDRCTSPPSSDASAVSSRRSSSPLTVGSAGASGATAVVLKPVVVGSRLARSTSRAPGRLRPAVRRRAGRPDPDHQERRPAADPVPRHLEHGLDRRRAGPARARLPPELQDQRHVLRLLHAAADGDIAINQLQASSTDPDVAVTVLRAADHDHRPAVREPQRRDASPSARRLPVHRDRRRRRRRRPGQPRPEPATRCSGKMLRINVNGTDRRAPVPDPGRQPVRRPVRPRRDLVARPAQPVALLVRPGRPATCGSATSARTGTRRSTAPSTASSGRGRGVNYGWRVMEGRHCYSPTTGCSTTGQESAGRRVQPHRRAAR